VEAILFFSKDAKIFKECMDRGTGSARYKAKSSVRNVWIEERVVQGTKQKALEE